MLLSISEIPALLCAGFVSGQPRRIPVLSTHSSQHGADCIESHSPKLDDVEQSRREKRQPSTLVDWDGPDDPQNPQNWSLTRKLSITLIASFCTFMVSFGSSILSPATDILAKEYNVGTIVVTLSIALYVLGFAAGPWAWAPFTEIIGRYWPFMIGYVGFICFTVGVACAQNLYTLLICRFMQGVWGIASVTVTPGIIVDLWNPRMRPIMTMAWTMTIQVAPSIAPIVGGFTAKNPSLGWRWTMWLTLIISAVSFLASAVIMRETCGPILLRNKACRLRFDPNDSAIRAKREEQATSPRALAYKYGFKPIRMLCTEVILLVVVLYNCFVYGITYLSFEAFPYAFGKVRGWEEGVSSLPFLSLLVGFIVGFVVLVTVHLRIMDNKIAQGIRPRPEDQLPSMIGGSITLLIGLFWFAWTSSPKIPWIAQVLAGPFIGCGISLVFIPCLTYIMEIYTDDSTSAMAAATIARSGVAAAFPLFSTPMYETLGVDWATSLLGFLCLLFVPAPIIFFNYGEKLRGYSRSSRQDQR